MDIITRSISREHFPFPNLKDLDPPDHLWVQGQKRALQLIERVESFGLGVVGTREPKMASVELVKKSLRLLDPNQFIVVSGFARGVDRAAHRAALANGIPTIAILGASLDQNYPYGTIELRQEILEAGGLLVSEFEPSTPPYRSNFLKRNRIIAAWSRATWIVESGFRSGALNTANWSTQMGRDVYATPCFPQDPAYAGNQKLLEQGAHPFWGTQSLGYSWLALSTIDSEQWENPVPIGLNSNSSQGELFCFLRTQTRLQAGATVESLLQWGIQQNKARESIFQDLEYCIKREWVKEKSGRYYV